jgi:hypothetical protein
MRTFALAAFAAPATLSLAACGSEQKDVSGEAQRVSENSIETLEECLERNQAPESQMDSYIAMCRRSIKNQRFVASDRGQALLEQAGKIKKNSGNETPEERAERRRKFNELVYGKK